jgi:hypothetical protein
MLGKVEEKLGFNGQLNYLKNSFVEEQGKR